ncbi:RNA-binding protein Csx1 [Schizosaccharomyces cryophilus OY26]|uniref:RNA-binding protein Csx1 n=1 Tax=Schizosaccharomyces cryophilus (strain OY26 / ATCC MYA-4695 / CBS 11777 / NBRC 106824 / NRRL Y48691) TaxID=653667 RepID=S9X6Q6_SCHCR|nr:RNA-binding protein Csx1 [Schizosaccharomyces cryophilus OY26]EPY52772.1 RNA-binding protein Csx1 [Schizosaccharomyces cryophilus OY26]
MSIDCLYQRSLFHPSFLPANLPSSSEAVSKMPASSGPTFSDYQIAPPLLKRPSMASHYSSATSPVSPISFEPKNNDTLWMGDLESWMDATYLQQLWASLGEPVNVKVMRSKTASSDALISYCFVQFASSAAAEHALKKYSDTVIPGAHSLFKLNWATGGGIHHANYVNRDPEYSVFVGDLLPTTQDSDLFLTFHSIYPSCTSAKIIVDPVTGLSRKYGFVRFSNEKEQQHALVHMQGYLCHGRPLRISVAAPKSRASIAADSALGIVSNPTSNRQPNQDLCSVDPLNTTVFVGGLSHDLTEKDLQLCFQTFGKILNIKIPYGKGCGFVQYNDKTSAEHAIAALQGALLGSSHMRLAWGHNTLPASALERSNDGDIEETGLSAVGPTNVPSGNMVGTAASGLKGAPVSPRSAVAAQSLLPNAIVHSLNGMEPLNVTPLSPPPLSRSASISPALSGSASGLTPLSSNFSHHGGQQLPSSVLHGGSLNTAPKAQANVKLPEWLQSYAGENQPSAGGQDLLASRMSSLKLMDDDAFAYSATSVPGRSSSWYPFNKERQSSMVDVSGEREKFESLMDKPMVGAGMKNRLARPYSFGPNGSQYLQPSYRIPRDV